MTGKFTAETKTGQPIPIDTLNLVAVMIGPMFQPLMPISDAAAFDAKVGQVANEIIREEEERIDAFKKNLVTTLRTKLPLVVRTANELDYEGIDAYRVEKAVPTENAKFPLVLFGQGDISFMQYGQMRNLRKEIESNNALSTNVAAFAEKFNLSNVAISYSRLAVISVGPFGGTGKLRMETYLLVFDRRGTISVEAAGLSHPVRISGNVLRDYTTELDKYRLMHDLFAIALEKQIMK
jgi:hypothetical protein